ncbi:MAG TPA: histidine phosphatase family protein [Sphingomicrobium sp.]|nr:histidine phosphatase family protein [Sphingomicrobium sp.]
MHHISILRHAKSRWDKPELADFDRPLNARGWEAARRLGKELKHRSFTFDLVIASPALRVRETIEGVRAEFAFTAPSSSNKRCISLPRTSSSLLFEISLNPYSVHC